MEDINKTRNLKLVIAYNGAAYHGWQRQAEGIDTVQARIETAAVRVLKHPLHAHGCSRTDAGVHAEGQVCNIRTPNLAVPLAGMRKAMNARLPRDIVVRSVTEAAENFDASRTAIGKTYRYRIHLGATRPVHLAGLVWHYWRPLEIGVLQEAANLLIGKHDFKGFASSTEDRKSTVRTVYRCDVAEAGEGEIHITVQGDGFLYNMVRNIVGTLVDVGRGRWGGSAQITKILASCDRNDAGLTAPAAGLTLMCVHYEPETLDKITTG